MTDTFVAYFMYSPKLWHCEESGGEGRNGCASRIGIPGKQSEKCVAGASHAVLDKECVLHICIYLQHIVYGKKQQYLKFEQVIILQLSSSY